MIDKLCDYFIVVSIILYCTSIKYYSSLSIVHYLD